MGKYEEIEEALPQMAGLPEEEIWVWFLDKDHTVIKREEFSDGDESGVDLSLRELFRLAWVYQAEAIFIAHNHPFLHGDVTSGADREFNEMISEIAEKSEVEFIQHAIVGFGDDGEVEINFTL